MMEAESERADVSEVDLEKPMSSHDRRAAVAAWSEYDSIVLPVGIHGHFPHLPPSDLSPHASFDDILIDESPKVPANTIPVDRPSRITIAKSIALTTPKSPSPVRPSDGSWMSKVGWHGCAHFVLRDGTTACSHLVGLDKKPLLAPFRCHFVPMRPYDHLCGHCKRLVPKDCLCGRCGVPVRSPDVPNR